MERRRNLYGGEEKLNLAKCNAREGDGELGRVENWIRVWHAVYSDKWWGGWWEAGVYDNIWGIQVILVMSVILWHEKTKIQKIIGCGNFDVFSVKTIIHNNIKKMGHLIWSLGVQLHAISWKWDVTRWHKAGWMIVVTCQTLFFCHKGTISAQ